MKEYSQKNSMMIVEDEAIIALSLSSSFEMRNYSVVVASTGERAIRLFKELQPDVIIMDIQLAGNINGIETSRQILNDRNIPIIFMTGYRDEKYYSEAMKLDPLAYLIKPVDIEEVCELIDSRIHC